MGKKKDPAPTGRRKSSSVPVETESAEHVLSRLLRSSRECRANAALQLVHILGNVTPEAQDYSCVGKVVECTTRRHRELTVWSCSLRLSLSLLLSLSLWLPLRL